MTVGLVLTIWLGVGAQIYKPSIQGHVPPPMTITDCPLRNITNNDTISYYDLVNTSYLYTTDSHSHLTTAVMSTVAVVKPESK